MRWTKVMLHLDAEDAARMCRERDCSRQTLRAAIEVNLKSFPEGTTEDLEYIGPFLWSMTVSDGVLTDLRSGTLRVIVTD